MKKIIITLALLGSIVPVFAQTQEKTYKVENKTIVAVPSKPSASEKATEYTYKDTKGREYPIFVGKSGACYIKKISSKTGNEYKQYLGEEISREICDSLGITYTGKSSN